MTINLESFKKKNARNFCLGVSAAAKYVAAEHTCKLSLQTRYFYNSGKIFDNPSWNLSHGICLNKSIKYLKDTFEGIFLYDRESVKLKLKVGECWLFGTPDVIGRVGNKLIILDAKSGASKFFHRHQVALYAEMASLQLGLEIGGMYLTYHNPDVDNHNFNVVELGSQDQIQEIWNIDAKRDLMKLANIIVSGKPAAPSPNENNCHWCDWKLKCKAVFKESEHALSLFSDVKV